ncbi:MAG TPA: hypothetical protein VLC98_04305 [Phnomibacter sp.]|nr:hypothetical protein [Phnomibacter sp.]
MHPDLLKILSNNDQPIDNEQLVAYLTGKLNAEESHALESKLSGAGFDEDAMEGLMMMQDKKNIGTVQAELNLFLQEKLHQPKKKKKRAELLSWKWLAVATGILILFILLSYFVIHYLLQ